MAGGVDLVIREILLPGLREDIPARVLAGRGVVALIRAQLGVEVQPRYERGILVLRGPLGVTELERFLLQRYAPSAIVSPWLKGSGFFGREGSALLERCEAAPAGRFEELRRAIREARRMLDEHRLLAPPEGEAKLRFLDALEARWSGRRWMAAAFDGAGSRRRANPQVGTGGNDGRLDYSQAFLRRLDALFELEGSAGLPVPRALRRLRGFLFEEAYPRVSVRWPTGVLNPSEAGGLSTSPKDVGPPRGSAWSLILTLEGLLDLRSPLKRGPDTGPLRRGPIRAGLFGIGGLEARIRTQPARFRNRGGPASSRSAMKALLTPLQSWQRALPSREALRPDLWRAANALHAAIDIALSDGGSPARIRAVLEALGRFAFLAPPAGVPLPPFPQVPSGLLRRADDGSLELRTAEALARMQAIDGGSDLAEHWLGPDEGRRSGVPARRARGVARDFFDILVQRARWSGHHPSGLLGPSRDARFLEAVRTSVDAARVSRLVPALFGMGPSPLDEKAGANARPISAPRPSLPLPLRSARERLLRGEHLRPKDLLAPELPTEPEAVARAALVLLLVGDHPEGEAPDPAAPPARIS